MQNSMIAGYSINPDVVFLIHNGGVLASNHRARRHVWMNINLFNELAGNSCGGDLIAGDVTRFSNIDGLMSDPTCLEGAEGIQNECFPSINQALDYLKFRFILIQDSDSYDDFFQNKRSLVDTKHFGTFHQQLGVELHLKHRQNPASWWYEQKFDYTTGGVKDNLYKHVQEAFYDNYIDTLDLATKTVLDFGCGNGVTSKRFVDAGANVIGVDPNEELLSEASRTIGDRFRPVLLELSNANPLGNIPDERVDLVWMSDVLLFYFYPQGNVSSRILPSTLLRQLTQNLAHGGKCVIMQPHGVFWLAPWLGDPERPYTVLTEYATRLYSGTPSLEELCEAIGGADLLISKVFEPKPESSTFISDDRSYYFARSFPLWWVFECKRSGYI